MAGPRAILVLVSLYLRFSCGVTLPDGLPEASSPPLGVYSLLNYANDVFLRHCNFQAFANPYEEDDDFHWAMIPALNGNGNGVSFQSTNYPDHYLTIVSGNGAAENGRLGIAVAPDRNDASFVPLAGLADPTQLSFQSLSANSAFTGKYIAANNQLSGICASNYKAPSGDVWLSDGSDAASATWFGAYTPPPPPPQVTIDATNVTHTLNPFFLGCHSDSGYTHQPRGFYAQMIFGESFEEKWNQLQPAGVQANFGFNGTFNNKSSYQVEYLSGSGYAGVSNRGLGNEGLFFQGGKEYEGFVYVKAQPGVQVWLAIGDYTADDTTLASVSFKTQGPADQWQQFNFSLTPSASTECVGIAPSSDPNVDCGELPEAAHICVRCGGEFAILLGAPGVLQIGYVYLQPGSWGRFNDLPVLQSSVDMLQATGTRLLRQGGTFAQTMYWKQWRGPATQRPSMQHTWGASLVSGWGPFEMIDLCNAAGIDIVITLAEDESNQDWADLVEYCFGNSSTTWGAQRYADGHPAVYNVFGFELGNEQYNPNFVQQVAAMEAKATELGMADTLYYLFPTNQGLDADDAAEAKQLGLPIDRIAPDIHIGGSGAVEVAEADFEALPAFPQSAINCETNAGTHTQSRALSEAADLNDWFNALPPTVSRLLGRTASFCSERSGHFDGFDQGITFFLPNMTWIQPPGYVHGMISQTWADQALFVQWPTSSPSVRVRRGPRSAQYQVTAAVTVSAQKTEDNNQIFVRVTNNQAAPQPVIIEITGASLSSTVAVWELANPDPNGSNTPAEPTNIVPQQSTMAWPPSNNVTVAGYSFTVFGFKTQ